VVAAVTEPGSGWRLIRVTALFLGVLLPLHVAVVVVRDDVGRTTFATVSDRFSGPWWPGLEWVTLVLALGHGYLVVGARRPGARPVVAAVAVVLGLGVTWTMLTFS
jgi:succinate dehydrogenase hydrophobic anchor subunit